MAKKILNIEFKSYIGKYFIHRQKNFFLLFAFLHWRNDRPALDGAAVGAERVGIAMYVWHHCAQIKNYFPFSCWSHGVDGHLLIYTIDYWTVDICS